MVRVLKYRRSKKGKIAFLILKQISSLSTEWKHFCGCAIETDTNPYKILFTVRLDGEVNKWN